MGTKLTREQIFYVVEAACDFRKYGEVKRKCPICGNTMVYIPKDNDAYTIKCNTDGCVVKNCRGF